jgi:hypothetical protein
MTVRNKIKLIYNSRKSCITQYLVTDLSSYLIQKRVPGLHQSIHVLQTPKERNPSKTFCYPLCVVLKHMSSNFRVDSCFKGLKGFFSLFNDAVDQLLTGRDFLD